MRAFLVSCVLFIFVQCDAAEVTMSDHSFVQWNDLRAQGKLNNPYPNSVLQFCERGHCTEIGKVDEKNVVHWNDAVTLQMLQSIVQSYLDLSAYQANQIREQQK